MAAASPNVGASQSSGGRESVREYSGANYHTFPPPNLLHMESHELRHIYTHTHTHTHTDTDLDALRHSHTHTDTGSHAHH